MFQVQNCLIADEVAHVQFACNLFACKGACCVVGNAGAPVEKNEIPILNKAWETLSPRLRDEAKKSVAESGVVQSKGKFHELSCTDGAECVFVTYDKNKVATCEIQNAFQKGEFDWPKPVSCHLFPLRISRIGAMDLVNYEYVPSICSPACKRGKKEGIYLSDFLKDALIRKYGNEWYDEFNRICKEMRKQGIGVA